MAFYIDTSYNKSFSQLAKESNFTFSLYRGRVDWKKIESLDVDRIVRDQDVELLDMNTSSINNCNLESEYDVKILDPNFIKLFKLAQLLIDFLLHCKKYLEHCIKVAHESVQTSFKEVEGLRKQLQSRKTEVKELKKKLKEVKQQLLNTPRLSHSSFECSLCGKFFMNEKYLQEHHSRRHHPHDTVFRPSNPRLTSHKIDERCSKHNTANTSPEDTNIIKKKYETEIEDLKTMFFAEIQKLKNNEKFNKETKTVDTNNDVFKITTDNKEQPIKPLLTTMESCENSIEKTKIMLEKENTNLIAGNDSTTKKEEEEEWLKRFEEREGVWRSRLSALDHQYKKQIFELQERLNTSQTEGQEMKKTLESRLEEVLHKFEQAQLVMLNKNNNHQGDYNRDIDVRESTPAQTRNESPSKNYSPEKNTERSKEQPPPFLKRKAFLSQKSKTIQDDVSFETIKSNDPTDSFVKTIEPLNDSDSENIPPQNVDENRSNSSEKNYPKQPSFIQIRNNNSKQLEAVSIVKSKENRINTLEEEKSVKIKGGEPRKEQVITDEEDSSITETLTETESQSESSEEKRTQLEGNVSCRQDAAESSDDDQIMYAERQLAQQSLKSMESLLASNPGILHQLREDLDQLCCSRLQQLGIDPGWGRLPPVSFHNKMAVLEHQRNITAKNHKVYFTLRDKISKDADAAVKQQPTKSMTDSVLARLRNKASQVINAVKFSRQLGNSRQKGSSLPKGSSLLLPKPQPLATSSPHLSSPLVDATSTLEKNTSSHVVPTTKSSFFEDSLSLSSSSTSDEDEKASIDNKTYTKSATTPESAFKSALRNAVSTGNLAKKKVLFVDEAIKMAKKSQSESTVAELESSTVQSDNVSSVASLVQEIKHQLSHRGERPAHSVDLMERQETQPSSSEALFDLPLSQILPLSKSGRELLETEEKLVAKTSVYSGQSPKTALSPKKYSDITLHTLKKVPLSNPNLLAPLEKSSAFLKSPTGLKKASSKNDTLKLSPVHSLTSIGSSLLDLSVSPRSQGGQGSLEWNLQDLEENLKD